ncbi:MAG: carboxypeptidase-like regulatory domain-containing protein, partial [Bacteroidota bacterium]
MLMLGAGLFYACSEELTPAQQLQQQLVELDASQYISFIAVVEDNGEPLAGATVTLTTVSVDTAGGTDTTGAAAGEIISQSATTDADGRAVFAAVQPGGHILEVTAEGHYATRAVADFDFVEGYNYTITDGFLVPTAVVESAILPLFATDAATVGNTATIEGTLTIETDVT